VKSQKHGITRSYSRRNCAPGRADTLFSAVRQYAYALPSGRVRLESRPGGYLPRFCKSQQLESFLRRVWRNLPCGGTWAHFLIGILDKLNPATWSWDGLCRGFVVCSSPKAASLSARVSSIHGLPLPDVH